MPNSYAPGGTQADLDRTLFEYEREESRQMARYRAARPGGAPPPGEHGSLVEGAGIIGSFRNRKEALRTFNSKLERAQKVVVVGSSLKGLLHPGGTDFAARAILRGRVSRQRAGESEPGGRTDFVLTHPAFADFRANQENRENQDIALEVIESLMYLKEWDAPPSTVHLYLGTPTCFGILADDQMILIPVRGCGVSVAMPAAAERRLLLQFVPQLARRAMASGAWIPPLTGGGRPVPVICGYRVELEAR